MLSFLSVTRATLDPSSLLQSTYSTRKCTQQVAAESDFPEADALPLRKARHQQRPGGREEQEAWLTWWRRNPGWLCVL